MTLQISGKNMDLGEALRGRAEARVRDAVQRYFGGGYSGTVILAHEGSGYACDCTIRLDSGIVLHAEGTAQDPTLSFEKAADRIEKRLRRYKRRLKDHPAGPQGEEVGATAYVLAAPVDEEEEPIDDNPVVIAEEATRLKSMTVGMAVMALDLAREPVVVFRNVANGAVNVVYRRTDGNIGWIDPSLPAAGRAGKG